MQVLQRVRQKGACDFRSLKEKPRGHQNPQAEGDTTVAPQSSHKRFKAYGPRKVTNFSIHAVFPVSRKRSLLIFLRCGTQGTERLARYRRSWRCQRFEWFKVQDSRCKFRCKRFTRSKDPQNSTFLRFAGPVRKVHKVLKVLTVCKEHEVTRALRFPRFCVL